MNLILYFAGTEKNVRQKNTPSAEGKGRQGDTEFLLIPYFHTSRRCMKLLIKAIIRACT